MYIVEFYLDDKFLGYLAGDSVYNSVKELGEATFFKSLDLAIERSREVINVSDTSDYYLEYYIVEVEFSKVKKYKPLTNSYFNRDFIVVD